MEFVLTEKRKQENIHLINLWTLPTFLYPNERAYCKSQMTDANHNSSY